MIGDLDGVILKCEPNTERHGNCYLLNGKLVE